MNVQKALDTNRNLFLKVNEFIFESEQVRNKKVADIRETYHTLALKSGTQKHHIPKNLAALYSCRF